MGLTTLGHLDITTEKCWVGLDRYFIIFYIHIFGLSLQYVVVPSCTKIPKSVETSHPTYESPAISLDHNFLYTVSFLGVVQCYVLYVIYVYGV